jgi:hypothetical protein
MELDLVKSTPDIGHGIETEIAREITLQPRPGWDSWELILMIVIRDIGGCADIETFD